MKRIVEPELLDQLPPADSAAQQARRDLRRINRLMGNAGILSRAMHSAIADNAPRELLELGAGDGGLLLQVARQLAPQWKNVHVRLLDRSSVVNDSTIAAFAEIGWQAESVTSDALDWFRSKRSPVGIVVANLFIHHFVETELRALFAEIAQCANLFVAVEPRRASLPLAAGSCLWAIGCNSVSRHDAVTSVRAGFAGKELSNLWPASTDWALTEGSAGFFSHLFIARRSR